MTIISSTCDFYKQIKAQTKEIGLNIIAEAFGANIIIKHFNCCRSDFSYAPSIIMSLH